MPTGVLVLIGFVFLFLWALLTPSRMDRAVRESIANHSPEPILAEIASRPEDFFARFYQQAMERLWPEHRELASMLTVAVVKSRPDVAQAHRWVDAIQQQHPQVAEQQFSAAFLAEHYNPNLQPNGG